MVPDDFQPATLPVSLLYATGRFSPLKLRAFLDFVAPRLKARLARDLSGPLDPNAARSILTGAGCALSINAQGEGKAAPGCSFTAASGIAK